MVAARPDGTGALEEVPNAGHGLQRDNMDGDQNNHSGDGLRVWDPRCDD